MTATLEEVINFNCTWCGMSLTVPAQMAGISGPCPKCGNNITSPQSTPRNALPTQAFSTGAGMMHPPVSVPAPLPQSAAPTQTVPASIGQNGNGYHQPPLDPKLATNNMPGALPTSGPLPQPGSSNRGAAVPTLRPNPVGTASKEVTSARSHNREAGSHDKGKRRGALLGALFMITLALAGTGFFFKEQVILYWKRALIKWKSHDVVEPTASITIAKPTPPNTGTSPAAFNPNTPVSNDPIVAIPQVNTGTSLPVPTPPVAIKEPIVAPTSPDNGSSPKPPLPNPPVNSGDPVEPLNKVELGPDGKPVLKALPVDQVSSPLPQPAINTTIPNPASLVEVPNLHDKPLGKVDAYSGEDKIFVSASPEAQPAVNVLKQFFAAKKWQDRLALTQAPDKVRPLMERYYGANNDGPLRISRIELIRHDRAPEMGTPHCVFQVSGPSMEQPLPVMVESSNDGWKVDWLTFTEFKDNLLKRFLQTWSEEPGRFHVMMRRTHYFDDDVPNLDKKYCFEMSPPEPGFSGFVFVPKGNLLARELDKSLGWEVTNVAAVVELQWRKQDRFQWVEMTAVPQYNWRGPDSAKVATAPPPDDSANPVVVEKARPVDEEVILQPALPRGAKK